MQERIKQFLNDFYTPQERPALEFQMRDFRSRTFLQGKKILDATPVFRNTLNKYIPLLEAGADLTVGYGGNVPFDGEIVELLQKWGIKTLENGKVTDEKFDFILDCAGANVMREVKYGVCELTRSGFYHYEAADRKVFLADSSRIKTIETALGTGDGFFRAMQKLGYTDFRNRKIMIFGCGKVGFGVAMYCLENGAEVYTVDDWSNRHVPADFNAVSRFDREKIDALIEETFCVVSATGIRHGLSQTFDLQKLVKSECLIANIGVEDEFGDDVPNERVLNNNQPLNFILDEPTHLKFIDPTMALHNAGIFELCGSEPEGKIMIPSEELNDFYLNIVREHGIINNELNMLEKYTCRN